MKYLALFNSVNSNLFVERQKNNLSFFNYVKKEKKWLLCWLPLLILMVVSTPTKAGTLLPKWLAPAEILTSSPAEQQNNAFSTKQAPKASERDQYSRGYHWEEEILGIKREMAALEQRMASHPLKPSDRTQWLMVFQQRLQDLGMNDNKEPLSVDSMLKMLDQMYLLSDAHSSQRVRSSSGSSWLKAVLPFLKQDIHYGADQDQTGLNYGFEWHTRGLKFSIEYRL